MYFALELFISLVFFSFTSSKRSKFPLEKNGCPQQEKSTSVSVMLAFLSIFLSAFSHVGEIVLAQPLKYNMSVCFASVLILKILLIKLIR